MKKIYVEELDEYLRVITEAEKDAAEWFTYIGTFEKHDVYEISYTTDDMFDGVYQGHITVNENVIVTPN